MHTCLFCAFQYLTRQYVILIGDGEFSYMSSPTMSPSRVLRESKVVVLCARGTYRGGEMVMARP
jgi:hypothetical protein